MSFEPILVRRLNHASEAVLLLMACLSPWAYGSVDAWAELGLDVGVALLALLGALAAWRSGRSGLSFCLPSVALAGLIALALAQMTPLPEGVLRHVSPATAALRVRLLPRVAERVGGATGPAVALPLATLSQDPEATFNMAARLAAAWIVFQSVLRLGDGRGAFRRFGLAIAINSTLLALFSVYEVLAWDATAGPPSHGGPFVCHNHLAAYLNIGLGLALGLLLSKDQEDSRSRSLSRRLWAGYAVGMISVGIAVSLSRSGFLATLGALIVTVAALRLRSFHLGGLVAIAVLVPAFFVALGAASPYQRRLATLLESASYNDRMTIWTDVGRAWPVYPVWGTGLGSFPVATARFLRHDRGEFYSHAENEYLEVLVEGGVVGLVLVLAVWAGIARLGRIALERAPGNRDRALNLGALFGITALAIQSLGDFAPHIPGVGVTAVILGAYLCNMGLDARRSRPPTGLATRSARRALATMAVPAVALAILAHGHDLERSEAALAGSGVPLPGTEVITADKGVASRADLERMRDALTRSLQSRSNWADGHLRLGLTYLGLYEKSAAEALDSDTTLDEPSIAKLVDPIRLHAVVHSSTAEELASVGGLLAQEPIRDDLVPAARSFLEARRCCPVLAIPHAELATLDYLLQGGDAAAVYGRRALGLAGTDTTVIDLLTRLAIQTGDLDLAARCWRKTLIVNESRGDEVAAAAASVLSPTQILDRVLPGGHLAIRFADRLYAAPKDRETRDQFLRAALRRLPQESDLTRAERLRYEAQAWFRLGEPARAEARMRAALALESRRADWRREYVEWLIAWGQIRKAHDQALIGLNLTPRDPAARSALESAATALAGSSAPTLRARQP